MVVKIYLDILKLIRISLSLNTQWVQRARAIRAAKCDEDGSELGNDIWNFFGWGTVWDISSAGGAYDNGGGSGGNGVAVGGNGSAGGGNGGASGGNGRGDGGNCGAGGGASGETVVDWSFLLFETFRCGSLIPPIKHAVDFITMFSMDYFDLCLISYTNDLQQLV